MPTPTILVTNDDSIYAPGISHLIDFMSEIGNVWVVAPNSPQSGKGHAVTVDIPIFCKHESIHKNAFKEFSISGTPSDCIKIALNELMPVYPDICISGINHGSNSSINSIYSGTVAGALEGAIAGIPSIAFSLLDFSWDAKFDHLKKNIHIITKNVLKNKLKNGIALNVNFPKLNPGEEFNGIKYCRQANAHWVEEFECRIHPRTKDRDYYWMLGTFKNKEADATDTDLFALENNFISIVPVMYDLTAYSVLEELKKHTL